ncbi:hypothetical protein RMCBS344292_06928 [Rhizopus microsporus]|nr:hypothetical protein RMCBS344292_06928 [Rhizopus microsporus]
MSSYKPVMPINPERFTITVPGTDSASQLSTEQLLEKNHTEFDIFMNKKKFHNHLSHHILAAYSLGASKDKLEQIFEKEAKIQRSRLPVEFKITRENYKEYAGNGSASTAFIDFFRSEIEKFGIIDTVRRWVFHGDFLARTVAGAFHPLIHIGYGLEFNIPGLVAEGLAMAACTGSEHTALVPTLPQLQTGSIVPAQAQVYAENASSTARGYMAQFIDQLSTQLSTSLGIQDKSRYGDADRATNDSSHGRREPGQVDIHTYIRDSPLVQIFNKIREDPIFDNLLPFEEQAKRARLFSNKDATDRIKHYIYQWKLEENTRDVQAKFKELHLSAALLAGSTAVRDSHPGVLKVDFFLMHALTSSEFLHQFISKITPSESVLLLRGHLASCILEYIVCGRPELNVKGLLNYQSPLDKETRNNQWTLVLDRALDAKEVHVIKMVRSCAVGQMINGPYQSTDLSKVWLQAAKMAIDTNGDWEHEGVGFDEVWKK